MKTKLILALIALGLSMSVVAAPPLEFKGLVLGQATAAQTLAKYDAKSVWRKDLKPNAFKWTSVSFDVFNYLQCSRPPPLQCKGSYSALQDNWKIGEYPITFVDTKFIADKLMDVKLIIPGSASDYQHIAAAYTQKYGEPTSSAEGSAKWVLSDGEMTVTWDKKFELVWVKMYATDSYALEMSRSLDAYDRERAKAKTNVPLTAKSL